MVAAQGAYMTEPEPRPWGNGVELKYEPSWWEVRLHGGRTTLISADHYGNEGDLIVFASVYTIRRDSIPLFSISDGDVLRGDTFSVRVAAFRRVDVIEAITIGDPWNVTVEDLREETGD